jgi:hypothetical protein
METNIDFTQMPFHGTFELTEGGESLGCSSGTFVDTLISMTSGVQRILTCDAGSRSGTFSLMFNAREIPGPGDLNGPWAITEATEDFSGLQGTGDFAIRFDGDDAGAETFTGVLGFGSGASVAVTVTESGCAFAGGSEFTAGPFTIRMVNPTEGQFDIDLWLFDAGATYTDLVNHIARGEDVYPDFATLVAEKTAPAEAAIELTTELDAGTYAIACILFAGEDVGLWPVGPFTVSG